MLKLREEKHANELEELNGCSSHDTYESTGYSSYQTHEPNSYSSQFRAKAPPRRGKYAYGGHGYNSYHPYPRSQPPYAAQKYKNRSVTFGKPASATELMGANEVKGDSPKSANNTLLTQSSRPQIKPKTLCPAFTSTGIFMRQRQLLTCFPLMHI